MRSVSHSRTRFNRAGATAGASTRQHTTAMFSTVGFSSRNQATSRLRFLWSMCRTRHMDHKNLNLDVAWFRELNPTVENIAVVCWRVLAPAVAPARLKRIRLWETERIYVDYEGT